MRRLLEHATEVAHRVQPIRPIHTKLVQDRSQVFRDCRTLLPPFRPVDGGWVSKFDSAQGATITLGMELKDRLRDLCCHAALIYGEHTHLADETAAALIATATDGRIPVFTIPGTSHYPMIDSALAFVAAVKGIGLTWRATARG